jgi:hypothetical protein
MADNQMVKIVFDFDLGNVPASAKKLSQYLKDNNLDLKFTKQSVDAATASLKQFATAQNAAGAAAATTGNQIKKSNMQWTNLALVIQDLPYGFRGIQNNLPALIGGFAGMSGAIYLAGSAIIAFFTAYNMGLFDSISTTNKFEAANKKAIESISQEATKVALLVSQYKNSNTSALERKEIIKELNSINPQYFGNLDKEKTSVNTLNDSYLAYIGNLGNVIKAKKLEEELTKNIEQRLKFETEAGIALLKSGYRNPELINQQNAALKKYNGMLQKEADLAERITNLSKVQVAVKTGGGKTPQALAEEKARLIKAANDAETQAFIDTLDERAQKEYKAGLELASGLEKMKAAGYANSETYYAAYRQNMLNIAKEYDDKEAKLQIDNRSNISKAILAINKQFAEDEKSDYKERLNTFSQYYNNLIDFATGNRDEQKAIYEQQVFDLDNMLYNNLISYDDYYRLLGDITKAWAVNNKAIINESFNTLMQIGNGVMASLGNALDMLIDKGATIGEVLTNAFQSLLKQLIKVTVAAAIAVALIAILFPGTLAKAGGALKLFGGLFSQGMGLGKNMFAEPTANGGVFSGPSYRLVGEYPGAKTNPEVVAPLDKLKSMMGSSSGSGEFVLRGNDLILAIQRSNSSLKLRRG